MEAIVIKVIVMGAMGRMGRAIVQQSLASEDIEIAGCVERKEHALLGTDIGNGIILKSSIESVVQDSEQTQASKIPSSLSLPVIIDFTSPEATINHLETACLLGCPMVIGTTGLNKSQNEKLAKAAESIPIVYAANMSLGMNLLFKLAALAAKALGNEYEVEILEAHHHKKVDAPSGSALKIAGVIAEALERDLDKVAVYGRQGSHGPRKPEEIGIFAIRGGDIIGEHTAMFIGDGERLEITHRVQNRNTFASGALRAARFAANASPGLYNMMDVLGI
ncbi:4-hydroxy-tetrahydrodipicolinate reductase [bacterium]|nr:4-hydroxy-tetrahydrodipicolinate reductase [bacterium]MBU1752875.1 4-hydroxy-tetrahydrodipicolinate reductase [bacterium]